MNTGDAFVEAVAEAVLKRLADLLRSSDERRHARWRKRVRRKLKKLAR